MHPNAFLYWRILRSVFNYFLGLFLVSILALFSFLIILPTESVYAQTTAQPANKTQTNLGSTHNLAPATNLPVINSIQQLYVTIRKGSSSGQDCVALHDCFNSEMQIINAGQTVTWYNDDSATHTVTSGRLSDKQNGTIFDSGLIQPARQFSFTFQKNGNFNYFCRIHPWMTGVILVGNPTSVYNEVNITKLISKDSSQYVDSINESKNTQIIAAEVNLTNQTVQTKLIDNSISVHTYNTSSDSLSITVNASEQTGPKVILVNLSNTTINVSELRSIGVMFDGKPIAPSPDVNAILHPKSTDNPSFAIIVTSNGAQILVLIPHFSTHTITITNLPKTTSPIPEFPATILPLVIALISIIALTRNSISILKN